MSRQDNQYDSIFTKKVRVRACGILKENNQILLLKHDGIGPAGHLWSPPGGGVDFGDTMIDTIKKEFLEETNLKVEVDQYLFTNEHIDTKHHSIEHFFRVHRLTGELKLGIDPELSLKNQILSEARFFTKKELDQIPSNNIHNAFLIANSRDKIDDLRGLITFKVE